MMLIVPVCPVFWDVPRGRGPLAERHWAQALWTRHHAVSRRRWPARDAVL